MSLLRCFIAIMLLCSTILGQSPEPVVELRVTPSQVSIGDFLYYNVSLKSNIQINLIKAPNEETFEVGAVEFIDQQVEKNVIDDTRYTTITTTLQLFDIQDQLIPTQQIVLKDTKTNKFMAFELPAYTVYIKSIKSEDSTNVLISTVFYKELDLNWMAIFFAVLLLSGIIFGIVFAIKKYVASKSVKQEQIDIPTITPIEKALNDIEQLYNNKQSILLKDYYVSFSEIIKVFIGSQIGKNLLESTTEEILESVALRLNEQDQRRLRKILQFSDQVKFARYKPSDDENKTVFDKTCYMFRKIAGIQSSSSQQELV